MTLLRGLCVSSMLLLTACQTTGSGATSVLCDTMKAVRWSVKDTRETIRRNVENNAAGRANCPSNHPNWTQR